MLHFILQFLLHLCLLKSTYCISYFISDASLQWQFEFFLSVYIIICQLRQPYSVHQES